MTVVLDTWSILEHLEARQPVAANVEALFGSGRPIVCWINLGEVFYVVRRSHGEHEAIAAARDIRDAVTAELPSADRVIEAARIKSEHRLSYADAFAAATAVAHSATLWTGDPELLVADAPWRWRDLRD